MSRDGEQSGHSRGFPYQIERPEPASGGCVVTRSVRLKPHLVIERRSANSMPVIGAVQ
jgi:hypothetical protein